MVQATLKADLLMVRYAYDVTGGEKYPDGDLGLGARRFLE
jgi:hypothetical protein